MISVASELKLAKLNEMPKTFIEKKRSRVI
jgi:hypothetical protein